MDYWWWRNRLGDEEPPGGGGGSAIAHKANFGTNQSKTAGTSIAVTGSQAVTTDDDIFVSYAGDDVGSSFSVTDNLGNTYGLEKEQINTGNVKGQLWRASVTNAGTLTTVTISWTTNVTAKAAVVSIFTGVASAKNFSGGANTQFDTCVLIENQTFAAGDLWIGTAAWECPGTDAIVPLADFPTGGTESGQAGTTGAGDASNITCQQTYAIMSAGNDDMYVRNNTSGRDAAGAGAGYSPA